MRFCTVFLPLVFAVGCHSASSLTGNEDDGGVVAVPSTEEVGQPVPQRSYPVDSTKVSTSCHAVCRKVGEHPELSRCPALESNLGSRQFSDILKRIRCEKWQVEVADPIWPPEHLVDRRVSL